MTEMKWQIREAITGALDADGVTQRELARRIGRTEKHVSFVLTGKTGVSLDLAEQMLAALGRRLVLTVEPGPPPQP